MKPTIPGLQNSWQPSVYPLPQQAPAAPPGLDPSSVYSFGQPWHTPNQMLNGEGGTIMAEAPKSPAAPGYLGPASAMAYQMAGPRVGFQTIPLPGASQAPQAPDMSIPTNPVAGNPFISEPPNGLPGKIYNGRLWNDGRRWRLV